MAEHFRDYLNPAVDNFAEEVLNPERDRMHKFLVRYGVKIFELMGAEKLKGDVWALPTLDGRKAAMQVYDPERFFPGVLRHSDVGLFYGYTGDNDGPLWSPSLEYTDITPDIDTGHGEPDGLVRIVEALSHMTRIPRALGWRAASLAAPIRDRRARHAWEMSVDRTKSEIAAHYDLSPEVYDAMLDKDAQYSSGLLIPGQKFESLAGLQEQKIESLISMLDLESAETLLEVGGGWGGLAVAIAERVPHIDVTSLTISHEQFTRAKERAVAAGVSDRVHFLELDYRDLAESAEFDRVVSVEMIEAVDWRDHKKYFDALTRHVHPGHGVIAMQAITIRPEQFAAQRHNKSFANTAIFPGGILTPKETIDAQFAKRGWELTDSQLLGPSYALTLREWIRNLWDEKPRLDARWQQDGIDSRAVERFWRGFGFYLAASEAGFRPETGPNISNWQLAYRPDGSR